MSDRDVKKTPYGNHHRMFLQNLLNKYDVLTKNKALDLYLKCMVDTAETKSTADGVAVQPPVQDQHKLVQTFIKEVNAGIRALNFNIKLMTCEATGQKVYVLHVVNENEITKAVALRVTTKIEREYLRVVIKAIVTNPAGRISEIDCINLNSSLPELKISKKESEKQLNNLADKKWIEKVDGKIYIGPRTMAEMKNYLIEQYEDFFETCRLCKELTLLGEKCPADCGIKLHRVCLEAYFATGASKKCVNCQEPWNLQTLPSPAIPSTSPSSSPSVSPSSASNTENETDEDV